ncbi:tail fiber protein (plasmid) [Paenibacillus sp. JNUCC32]|uniref:phage tail protein n=1 Tax=Paenibacillus sp. JNUCC32 TaxID=2777984 RepID=UPI00178847F9|nr:phage tail protein [Paenibacillus sp. JNUCC-32]QOT13743.1 tail fiber protein [Paenibacillus sp. JNUCC-32]
MAQTANLGLPLIDANMTADVPRDMNALAEAVDTAVTEAVEGVTVPDATTTQKGVVQLNDTTTSTNKTQAGTADAVRRAYDRGSEGVTAAAAAQAKADAAETPAGAQAKANTAETNAKNASLPRTGGLLSGDGPIFGIVGATHAYQEYYPKGIAAGRKAYTGFGGDLADFHIQCSGGNIVFLDESGQTSVADLKSSVANGKQAIATAISGKGVPASGSDEFAVLANKISQIKTGIQVSSGNLAVSTGARTISNLPFKPQILIVYGRAETLINSGYQARARGYGIAYNLSGSNTIGNSLLADLYRDGFSIETNTQTLTNVVFGANSVSFDGITGTVSPNGTAYIVFGV